MTDLKLSRLVGEFIGEGRDSFTLDDFAGWAAAAGSPFAYRDDLEHAADFFIREGFLSKDREGFRKASSWFRGARFLVSLTDREVRDRVLIPGHRFLPFAANATAPWNCTLKTADGREMEKKTIPIPFGDLGIYVLLFGRESLPVYLLGDRPENGEILASGEITPSAEAVITVFDLAPFFKDPGFAGGDALLLTAEEYEAGIFTLERMPASKIPDEEAKASYVRTLDTAFRAVFRTFGPSISIGQQIGSALYRAGRKILRNPPMHFGGYLAATKKVALATWLDHSILWSGPAPDEPDEPEDMGTLDRYLTLLGVSLSEEEIQACMRDELFAGGASLDRVNERCFGGRELRFPSKEDRKEFEAHLRELWEETGRVYNLFTDQSGVRSARKPSPYSTSIPSSSGASTRGGCNLTSCPRVVRGRGNRRSRGPAPRPSQQRNPALALGSRPDRGNAGGDRALGFRLARIGQTATAGLAEAPGREAESPSEFREKGGRRAAGGKTGARRSSSRSCSRGSGPPSGGASASRATSPLATCIRWSRPPWAGPAATCMPSGSGRPCTAIPRRATRNSERKSRTRMP